MPVNNRREFLKMSASSMGLSMLSPSIARALNIPAKRVTGTIQDVQHVVILMQENRSFDHYFGSLRGVRGFADPRPARMPGGNSVWHQPVATNFTKHYQARGLTPGVEHVLPFYLNPRLTTEYQAGTDHGWSSGHQAWNNGHWNRWVNAKQDTLTMGHLKREDVSFHYALADAFTVCDSYFCSIHANTAPNRIALWSGTIDPANRLGVKPNGPGIEERGEKNGYTWTTYPERLEKANVSWKVYQGGSGEPGTPTDNYTDNSLEFFSNFQVAEGAKPDSSLVQKGVSTNTLRDFRNDVVTGHLPQVSWIVAPYKYCEHPEASPTDGAHYISLVLDALTASPEVWSNTVFLINYDENDGLFDHVVPPMPPVPAGRNKNGLVSAGLTESLRDELLDVDHIDHTFDSKLPEADLAGLQPVGLGPRVPMLVISPWSTGGWVCSQVFDHTSVLQFLEARFGVSEPNISQWRRSVCGDLTSAFDFTHKPATGRVFSLKPPQAVLSQHQPYQVPVVQAMPEQEPGVRPARALPYEFYVDCQVDHSARSVELSLVNQGKAGAAFYVYREDQPNQEPRRYTVASGDTLSDLWTTAVDAPYCLIVQGPNGAHCEASGSHESGTELEAKLRGVHGKRSCTVALENKGSQPAVVTIHDRYGKAAPRTLTLQPHQSLDIPHDASASQGWFDLSVTVQTEPGLLRRFAGHIEDGRPSSSDPGYGDTRLA
nr:phospholipase C, phosphocholine-specific [Granulicella aggregans]